MLNIPSDLKLKVIQPHQPVNSTIQDGITSLFDRNYFNYHFKSKLFDVTNIRFIVFNENCIVGYGAVQQNGPFAILSNLLVDRACRGKGVGALIEAARLAEVYTLGLCPYSSCVTFGTRSQKLKIEHGLRPINYKLGNRIGVFGPDNVSSAVVFLGNCSGIETLSDNRRDFDDHNDRTRLVCSDQDYFNDQLPLLISREDSYVDVLTTPEVRLPSSFVFQGYDIDFPTLSGGLMFQLDNSVRKRGLTGSLDLTVELASVESSLCLVGKYGCEPRIA